MKVGKTCYKVTTDKNGYATKTFAFVPGKYTIVSSYKGYSVKNTLTIKKVLSAKSKTSKKAKKIKSMILIISFVSLSIKPLQI